MRARLALLGLLALTLVGVIVLQLNPPEPVDAYGLAAPRRPPPLAGVTDDRGDPADAVRRVLARPLFNPDRRPTPPSADAAATGPASPPRLAGILVSPDGRQAIFTVADRSIVVREGGRIGDFLVIRIDNLEVSISGPSGTQSLRPSYAPADGVATAIGRAVAGTAAAFRANPAPSGLDILRNAARLAAPPAPGSQSAPPGQEQTGIGSGPPAAPARSGPLDLPSVPQIAIPESTPSR